MRDPHDDFLRYDNQMETKLMKRPICVCCGEHIQEDAYRLEDGLYCWDCAVDWLRDQAEEIEEDD